MYRDHHITIVMPAFNEEASLPKVIGEIPRELIDRVIVVDNGSSDETAEVARKLECEVFSEEKKGYGAACLKGISAIDETDILVILDADYSDYPQQVVQLLDPIVSGESDFVIGSRVLGKREKGALLPQAYWGNKLAVSLIRLLYGVRFTDMGPFRAIRFKALKAFNMEDPTFGWNVEMQVKAIKSDLRIQEVPVDYRKRIGTSKISGTISGTFRAGYKIIASIFKYHRWTPQI